MKGALKILAVVAMVVAATLFTTSFSLDGQEQSVRLLQAIYLSVWAGILNYFVGQNKQ